MIMNYKGLNLHNTELAITAGIPSQLVKNGIPQIAFAGRSNVGKSSLVNSLLGRKKLARVSSEPGKTITVNYYCVDKSLYLVDLPGYGFARRPKQDALRWQSLTQSYFEAQNSLKLVLQLVDIKVGFTADDKAMLEYMAYYDVPYLIVATKCDKLNKTDLQKQTAKIVTSEFIRPGTGIVLYSSQTGQGRDELWDLMLSSIT